jgi:type VI secretion system ImpM family protein
MAWGKGPVGAVYAFGKVRSSAEFVGQSGGVEPFASFVEWLDRGIGSALQQEGPSFRARFAATGAIGAFVPRSRRGGAPLAAVLVPSADSVGRAFPFAVMASMAEPPRPDAAAAAASLTPFLLEAYALASEVVTHGQSAGLAARVASIQPPDVAAMQQAHAELAEFAAAPDGLSRVLSRLFDGGRDRAAERAMVAVRALASVLRPLRNVEQPPASFSIRLPLADGGPLAVSYWLAVIGAITHGRAKAPAVFWSLVDPNARALFHFGDLLPAAFASVWPGGVVGGVAGGALVESTHDDARDEHILDLVSFEPSAVGRFAPLAPTVATVLASPRAAVGEILAALEA